MLFSLSELIETGTSMFPAVLAPPSVLAELASALKALPPALLEAFLECRLDDASDRVDVSALIPTDEGRRRLWAMREAAGSERETETEAEAACRRLDPGWSQVFAFVGEWVDARSPLHTAIPFIWLEFDRCGASAKAPFVVFYVQPSHYRPQRAPGETPYSSRIVSPQACKPILRLALESLRGAQASLPSALEDPIDCCLDALPEGGFLTYAAPLISRGDDTVRLNVAVPNRLLFDYLKAIRWTGSCCELRELLRETGMPPGVPPETIWFDLDVGAGVVLPSIKVDYHFEEGDPRWLHLFERLVALGLCDPTKRDAALGWPGFSRLTLPGRQRPCGVQRGLTVKVTSCNGAPMEAKAYLDFGCRFLLFG